MTPVDAAPSGVMPLLPTERRGLLVAFLAVAVLDVVGEAAHLDIVANVAKPLLIPLLLAWVLAVRGSASPRLLVAGLVLAWLGDVALMLPGDTAFLLGLMLFLGMQLCYIAGFVGLGAIARLRARPWIPVVGVVLWIGLNVVLGPSLGALRIPLLVYSAALMTMAVTACGVSVRVGVGGVVFLVSDLLIGLDAAGIAIPGHGPVVMATYAVGQLFIATGWVAAYRSSAG
jgi:uncharacterized membrane protein YhhN